MSCRLKFILYELYLFFCFHERILSRLSRFTSISITKCYFKVLLIQITNTHLIKAYSSLEDDIILTNFKRAAYFQHKKHHCINPYICNLFKDLIYIWCFCYLMCIRNLHTSKLYTYLNHAINLKVKFSCRIFRVSLLLLYAYFHFPQFVEWHLKTNFRYIPKIFGFFPLYFLMLKTSSWKENRTKFSWP